MPQSSIGGYRVDFLLVIWICCVECRDPECVEHRVCIAVECDGHDWHERTPEQAQRDKSRDRQIQGSGIPVLRFTGQEIWRDADRCASEVICTLDRAAIFATERTGPMNPAA